MKISSLLLALLAFCLAGSLSAAEKIVAGPKGGRLLDTEPQPAEFFVTSSRTVEITFYDASLKPAAPQSQVVSVVAEAKSGRSVIPLERTAGGFVAQAPLPSGEPYRLVVQIRATPEAKPKNFRIDFNPALCAECQHAEYACTCESH